MDLNEVAEVVRPRTRNEACVWRPDTAWLAGGSWLFSEPQPGTRRLIDLAALDWPPLEITERGLGVSATCTLAQLRAWSAPKDWRAARLIEPCCRALVGSFKIWSVATVGGNLCLALPAAPMAALGCALEATCVVWTPEGGERRIPALDFILGERRTALRPAEILRRLDAPATAFRRNVAIRRGSLSAEGRSACLLIGSRDERGAFALTVTAAVPRPIKLDFARTPTADELREALSAAAPSSLWLDDVHGGGAWRRRITHHFAEQIRAELAESGA